MTLVYAALAAILAKSFLIGPLTGYRYNPFTDPFDAGKLALDLAVYAALFLAFWWLFSVGKARVRTKDPVV